MKSIELPLDFSALDSSQRYLHAKSDVANESGKPQNVELPVSAQEMARQDHCTVCGEAEKDDAQDCVSDAEEDRVDAVGNETDDDGERCEPGVASFQICAHVPLIRLMASSGHLSCRMPLRP